MIDQVFVDINHIRCHSCETAGGNRTVPFEVEGQVARLVLISLQITMIVRTTATSCCSSVTKSFFVHLPILSYRLTQEWILTRTNVRQTAIVQLDIVVRTYEHTTTIAFSLIFEVLQIDIVTLFVTTADFDIREFGNILYLS